MGSILHTIICIYLLYESCIQTVYIIFLIYIFVDQMYTKCLHTKCLYTKCIPYFSKLVYTFCMQNLVVIVLSILYKVCWMGYKFCIRQFYTSCTIFVYQIYTQFLCIVVIRQVSFKKLAAWKMLLKACHK